MGWSRRRFLGMGVDVPRKRYRLRRCSLLSIWFDDTGARACLGRHLHGFLVSSTRSPGFCSEPVLIDVGFSRETTAPSRSGAGHQAYHLQQPRLEYHWPHWCGLCRTARNLFGFGASRCRQSRMRRNFEWCRGNGSSGRRTDRLSQGNRVRHRGTPIVRRRTWQASDRQIQPMDGFAPFWSCVQHDGNGRHRTDKFNRGAFLHHLRGCGENKGNSRHRTDKLARGKRLATFAGLQPRRQEQPASDRQIQLMARVAPPHLPPP